MELMCQTAPCLLSEKFKLQSVNLPFHLDMINCPEVKKSETRLYYLYHCNNLCPPLNSKIVRQPYTFSIVNRVDDLQPQEPRPLPVLIAG